MAIPSQTAIAGNTIGVQMCIRDRITTNLTYLPPEIHNRPYFIEADMSKFMAIIIDSLNHDISISSVLNPTDKIHALIAKHNAERFGSVK